MSWTIITPEKTQSKAPFIAVHRHNNITISTSALRQLGAEGEFHLIFAYNDATKLVYIAKAERPNANTYRANNGSFTNANLAGQLRKRYRLSDTKSHRLFLSDKPVNREQIPHYALENS